MTGYKGHLPLERDRQDPYSDANDYKAKCAIAERLEDIKLRKWCVDRVYALGRVRLADAELLFKYIKEGAQNAE